MKLHILVGSVTAASRTGHQLDSGRRHPAAPPSWAPADRPACCCPPQIVRAQGSKVRVGFMLPYTGTFAQLGVAIENGVRMAIDEKGGKLGGREIEWFKVDDESEPSKGVENAHQAGAARQGGRADRHRALGRADGHPARWRAIPACSTSSPTPACMPPRARCARPTCSAPASPTASPPAALGKPMMDKGLKKAVWITWKYAAGDEAFEGFKDSYTKAGGTIVKELGLPFPNVEFQALLTEIASAQARRRGLLLCRRGAAKFIKDYAAAGLQGKIPLYGSGFLTEGVLDAAGPAAEGIDDHHALRRLARHAAQQAVPPAYAKFKLQPDVYAVQGYDTGQLLLPGANAVKGDLSNKAGAVQGHGNRRHRQPARQVDHEQGPQPGAGHLPARGREKEQQGAGCGAAKALADSGAGCKMGAERTTWQGGRHQWPASGH
jgi:branched-chain amino acid transport system substrate-binding protein